MRTQRGPRGNRATGRAVAVLAAILIGVAVVAACGSSSSSSSSKTAAATTSTPASSATTSSTSKPAYCAQVSNLKVSVQSLSNINVTKVGVSGLKSALAQVQSSATALISAVHAEFASQTAPLKSSLDTLATTVKQAAQSPSASQLGQLAVQLPAVVTAARSLVSKVSPSCG